MRSKLIATAIAVVSTITAGIFFAFPAEARSSHYTVQSGDTLASIAQRHNSSVVWIQSANMIADPRTLQVGLTLFIPQK